MDYQEQVAFMGNIQWEYQKSQEECFFGCSYGESMLSKELDIEGMFKSIMENQIEHQRETDRRFNEFQAQLDQATSTIKDLGDQMDHIVSLSTSREFCEAIMLRSGKELPSREGTNVEDQDVENVGLQGREPCEDEEEEKTKGDPKPTQEIKKKLTFVPPPYEPKVPFPGRVKKQLLEKQRKRFMDLIEDVMVTIPLLEAIEDNPVWRKFFKDMVTKKKRMDEGMVLMGQECSSIIDESIPKKLKDPGSFSLPCSIGKEAFPRCLCDLGSSVNLMPLSIATKLGLTKFKPSGITLVLADRSMRYPVGV